MLNWINWNRTVYLNKMDLTLNNDTKQSDGEALVIWDLWGMQRTSLVPSHPGKLWPRVVAPDRLLSMFQIELNCTLMINWIVWNRTVYLNKMDLTLNNQQRLMCHKNQTNKIKQTNNTEYGVKLYLMVRLQSWNFRECAVVLHCHYSQVHKGPDW